MNVCVYISSLNAFFLCCNFCVFRRKPRIQNVCPYENAEDNFYVITDSYIHIYRYTERKNLNGDGFYFILLFVNKCTV